jgi:hypothetical protein
METDKLFNETKIKMVMRLRGVSHDEAVELIKNGKTAAEKSAHEDKDCSSRDVTSSVCTNEDTDVMSAEEFFSDMD